MYYIKYNKYFISSGIWDQPWLGDGELLLEFLYLDILAAHSQNSCAFSLRISLQQIVVGTHEGAEEKTADI